MERTSRKPARLNLPHPNQNPTSPAGSGKPQAVQVPGHGLKLRLWDHGGPGIPALVLHGHLDTGRSFDALAEHCKPHLRCLCLDARGHGESDWASADAAYHTLDHLKDLAAVLRHLAGTPLAPELLIGHSLGGVLALMAAATMPDSCRGLVLMDSLGAVAEEAEKQVERLALVLQSLERPKAPFRTAADAAAAVDRVRKNNPGLSHAGAWRMVRYALRPTQDGRVAFAFDPRLRGPVPVRYPTEAWCSMLAALNIPVLVLSAEFGFLQRLPDASLRLKAIRELEHQQISRAHHHFHVDYPNETAQPIVDWVNAISADSSKDIPNR